MGHGQAFHTVSAKIYSATCEPAKRQTMSAADINPVAEAIRPTA